MALTLSKKVPARKKTLRASWCRLGFTTMSDRYRAIRSECKYKGFDCYWCGHTFENGEVMALACVEKTGNKILCQTCGTELSASEAEPCTPTQ